MAARRFLLPLLLCGGVSVATAQINLVEDRMLPKPVEPGSVAPMREAPRTAGDPAETDLMAVAAPGLPTLQDWYSQQARPGIVLFFDRRLERLPADWRGTSRLTIARDKKVGATVETENLTLGVEVKASRASVASQSPLAQSIENAIIRELQRTRFKLIDPTLVERGMASKGMGERDTEFSSLQGSADYLLEVGLVSSGGVVSMLGSFKRIRSGEVVATVRAPSEGPFDDASTPDILARAFVKRLLSFRLVE